MDCAGKCAECDIRNNFETVDGMPVQIQIQIQFIMVVI